jgi:hypothetical protein
MNAIENAWHVHAFREPGVIEVIASVQGCKQGYSRHS